jgi:hypothetical protein
MSLLPPFLYKNDFNKRCIFLRDLFSGLYITGKYWWHIKSSCSHLGIAVLRETNNTMMAIQSPSYNRYESFSLCKEKWSCFRSKIKPSEPDCRASLQTHHIPVYLQPANLLASGKSSLPVWLSTSHLTWQCQYSLLFESVITKHKLLIDQLTDQLWFFHHLTSHQFSTKYIQKL